MIKAGTTAEELINDLSVKKFGYVSGYYPKEVLVTFDFHKVRTFTHLEVENYFNEQSNMLSKRGMKAIEIYTSDNGKAYKLQEKATLDKK